MSPLVCVKSFANRPATELAKGVLEAAGIRSTPWWQWTGGWRPGMGFTRGARLFVDANKTDRAVEILGTEH